MMGPEDHDNARTIRPNLKTGTALVIYEKADPAPPGQSVNEVRNIRDVDGCVMPTITFIGGRGMMIERGTDPPALLPRSVPKLAFVNNLSSLCLYVDSHHNTQAARRPCLFSPFFIRAQKYGREFLSTLIGSQVQLDCDSDLADVDPMQLRFRNSRDRHFNTTSLSPMIRLETVIEFDGVDSDSNEIIQLKLGDSYDSVYMATYKGVPFCFVFSDPGSNDIQSEMTHVLDNSFEFAHQDKSDKDDDYNDAWLKEHCSVCHIPRLGADSTKLDQAMCSACDRWLCTSHVHVPFSSSSKDGARRLDTLCPECSDAASIIDCSVFLLNLPGKRPCIVKVHAIIALLRRCRCVTELSLCAQVMPAIIAKGLTCTTSASAYLLVMMCHKEVYCGCPDKIYGKTLPAIKALLQMLHRQWIFLTTRMSRRYMFSDIKLGNILLKEGNVFGTCDYESIVCIDAMDELACCHSFLGLQSGLDGIGATIDSDGLIHLNVDCDQQSRKELAKVITCGALVAMFANVLDPELDDLFLVGAKENIFTTFDPSHPLNDGNRLTDLLGRMASMKHKVQQRVKIMFYTLLVNMLHQAAHVVSLGDDTSPVVQLELQAYGELFNAVTDAHRLTIGVLDASDALDESEMYLATGSRFISEIDIGKWTHAVSAVRKMAASVCIY